MSPFDYLTFALMAILFLAVPAIASYLPAPRAASVDPAACLRIDFRHGEAFGLQRSVNRLTSPARSRSAIHRS
jgi:hypothetical protein